MSDKKNELKDEELNKVNGATILNLKKPLELQEDGNTIKMIFSTTK